MLCYQGWLHPDTLVSVVLLAPNIGVIGLVSQMTQLVPSTTQPHAWTQSRSISISIVMVMFP
jgi:hypothetical protein